MTNDHSYLVLDTIRVPGAKTICAQNENEWEPLYLGTIWQHQIDLSPIWIRIDPKSAVWKKWETDPNWASSGIIFTFPNEISQNSAISSLQEKITAKSEDGRLFLLRFYSPYTLSQIAKYGERTEIDGILGDAISAQISPLLSKRNFVDVIENAKTRTSLSLLSNKLVKELLA